MRLRASGELGGASTEGGPRDRRQADPGTYGVNRPRDPRPRMAYAVTSRPATLTFLTMATAGRGAASVLGAAPSQCVQEVGDAAAVDRGEHLGCALVTLAVWRAAVPATEATLRAATERWAARPFTRYQLTLVERSMIDACTHTAEIAEEQVVRVIATTCTQPWHTPPRSVTALFAELEPYTRGTTCGPNGCDCDRLVLAATYDGQWGYPRTAQVQQVDPPWRQRLRKWLSGDPACTLTGFASGQVEVQAVTPLPPP